MATNRQAKVKVPTLRQLIKMLPGAHTVMRVGPKITQIYDAATGKTRHVRNEPGTNAK